MDMKDILAITADVSAATKKAIAAGDFTAEEARDIARCLYLAAQANSVFGYSSEGYPELAKTTYLFNSSRFTGAGIQSVVDRPSAEVNQKINEDYFLAEKVATSVRKYLDEAAVAGTAEIDRLLG